MKALFALCCFLAAALLSPGLAAGEWFFDFEKAKAESEKTGRPIFILFSNPDEAVALGYNRKIFSQKKFLDYADKKLVLMRVDFPVAIHRQPKSLRDQNSELKSRFGIAIMPAAILADANGDLFTSFVNADGGMEKHQRKLREIMDFDPPKRYTEYLDGFVKTYKPPQPKKAEEPQQPKTEAKPPARRPSRRPARKPDANPKTAADEPVVLIPDANAGTPLIPLDPEGDFQEWLKARTEEEAKAEKAGEAGKDEAKGPAKEEAAPEADKPAKDAAKEGAAPEADKSAKEQADAKK